MSNLGINSLSEEEIEFLSGDVLISIVPFFKKDSFDFISGEYGPFQPNVAVKVPLWLAIKLRKQRKCKIQQPEWLQQEALKKHLQAERENSKTFMEIDWHYIEVAKLLFQNAPNDIKNCEKIRSLVKSIEETREEKICIGLKSIDCRTTDITVNNISCMELNKIRDYTVSLMAEFDKFKLE